MESLPLVFFFAFWTHFLIESLVELPVQGGTFNLNFSPGNLVVSSKILSIFDFEIGT